MSWMRWIGWSTIVQRGKAMRPVFRQIQTHSTKHFSYEPKELINMSRLKWKIPPKRVLLMKKPYHPEITAAVVEMARWLKKTRGIESFVEPVVAREANVAKEGLGVFKPGMFVLELKERMIYIGDKPPDFVVTAGGDGTLLWTSRLFRDCRVPPVVSFNMGSMGFLTPFQIGDFREVLDGVLDGEAQTVLRKRLGVSVERGDGSGQSSKRDEERLVINDVVMDRGSHTYMTHVDLLINGRYVTTLRADGVIIASATGSTAYSLAAGGSMCHPVVPCILITPICAHTLNARPLILPDTAEIALRIPERARHGAFVSYDGVMGNQLNQGDRLIVRQDWFRSLATCLNWNTANVVREKEEE